MLLRWHHVVRRSSITSTFLATIQILHLSLRAFIHILLRQWEWPCVDSFWWKFSSMLCCPHMEADTYVDFLYTNKLWQAIQSISTKMLLMKKADDDQGYREVLRIIGSLFTSCRSHNFSVFAIKQKPLAFCFLQYENVRACNNVTPTHTCQLDFRKNVK